MKSCTFDCSSMHLVNHFVNPRYDRLWEAESVCSFGYCTHDDAPRRPLPPCAKDAAVGLIVTWGDPCAVKEPVTERLWEET